MSRFERLFDNQMDWEFRRDEWNHQEAAARNACPVCDGKGFVNPNGTPNNAFEGSDSDPVKPCPRCQK